jgi:hypothetical protein
MLVTGNRSGLVKRWRQVYAASYSENLLLLALDLPVENYQSINQGIRAHNYLSPVLSKLEAGIAQW